MALPQIYRNTKKINPAGLQFAEKNLLEQRSNRVAYWRLDPARADGADVCEELVQTAANCAATPASVVWDRDNRSPANLLCPEFDGSASTVDLYSAQLNTAMDWTNFTISLWFKVGSPGDWTNSTAGRILTVASDANNYVRIDKSATNNTVDFSYAGQSTADSVAASMLVAGESPVGWVHLALTVSDSSNDNELKAYIDGVQSGSTQTGIGVFAGAIDSDLCLLGSSALASPADQLASGSLVAELGIWSAVLSAAEVLRLSSISASDYHLS